MAGLIPFNRKKNSLARTDAGYEDFYNMLDDFFSDSWMPSRNLMRDTFKIDIEETDNEYRIEAELPGVKKEEIDLGVMGDNLSISVKDGCFEFTSVRDGCTDLRRRKAAWKLHGDTFIRTSKDLMLLDLQNKWNRG